MKYRIEEDSFGKIEIEDQYYWGAQTQRSINNFKITDQKMPKEVIRALAIIKSCAAKVHKDLKLINDDIAEEIIRAAGEILTGKFADNFPLVVWQTGSGTQSNMNMNEVIANICNERMTKIKGAKFPVHPNDHVNKGQSSNDTFPTAMHISTVIAANEKLIPALSRMHKILDQQAKNWKSIVKIGRTHLQDATPITLGQEFSAYAKQIELSIKRAESSLKDVHYLAQGGTAVGTGINCHKEFAVRFAKEVNIFTAIKFETAENKFEALASCDALVEFSGSLNTIAVSLMKIANDIRLIASGPRCGLGEIKLPANEPGSSIMPGKVNPTQCEAVTMAAAQVMGNHQAVTIAGSNGHLQLNVFRPMIIYNIINSINLLSDSVESFTNKCLIGIEPDIERINFLQDQSLMLVTALNPYIGYDKAAKIAKMAYDEGLTLRQAAIKSGLISDKDFDKLVIAEQMVGEI